MAGVFMPKRQQSNNGSLMTLAGMGAGAALGGPGGAAAGGSIGGMVGGQMSAQTQGPAPVDSGALSRRQAAIDSSSLGQIRNSIDSLKYIEDDATRVELAKPLLMAQYKAGRGANG